MSYFARSGDTFWPVDTTPEDFKKELNAQVYVVGYSDTRGYFLKVADSFDLNGKIYGKTEVYAARIIDTFMSRPNTTGVLLSGDKGSGKSMLAKLLSMKAIKDHNIPTILVTDAHKGAAFMDFIQGIEQPVIMIFDEFEKVYEPADQNSILTMLDGVYSSKKMIVLTCNDPHRINEHMMNRPGRLFYRIDYKGLPEDVIREYCVDAFTEDYHLKDIEKIIQFSKLFKSFSFDMLKAITEEMVRYGMTFIEAVEILNVTPNANNAPQFNVLVSYKDKIVKSYTTKVDTNPLFADQSVYVYVPDSDGSIDENCDTNRVIIGLNNYVEGNLVEGKLKFKQGDYVFDVERTITSNFDYMSLLG